jgi:hypothetical protein
LPQLILSEIVRVSRLGENSSFWRLNTLGIFVKLTEMAQTIGLFFRGKSYVFNFHRNGLGYILGDFFTDTSGHPGNRMAKDEIAR